MDGGVAIVAVLVSIVAAGIRRHRQHAAQWRLAAKKLGIDHLPGRRSAIDLSGSVDGVGLYIEETTRNDGEKNHRVARVMAHQVTVPDFSIRKKKRWSLTFGVGE